MNRPSGRSRFRALGFLPFIVAVIASCESGVVVPSAGQAVHIWVSGDAVRLQPATVRAGDVYLVVDSAAPHLVLVEAMAGPDESPGPLSDDDLDRIARGDTFHTSMTSGFRDSRLYGNVTRAVFAPGKYAFLSDAPESLAARSGGNVPPESMAVLEVLP